MNIIVYVVFFIIGALFGSFYTLAVYRIPLKQDIIHSRSYCPKCNHKLKFFDTIGSEDFISQQTQLIRETDGFIFMYDATNEKKVLIL